MGTKTHPGKYDCYSKAKPNEPMFVLLGRDRFASGLVHLWSALRSHDYVNAAVEFGNLCEIASEKMRQDDDRAAEAHHCGIAMGLYHAGEPYCRICLCTCMQPCSVGISPCAWADKTKTLCTNPSCLKAARRLRRSRHPASRGISASMHVRGKK